MAIRVFRQPEPDPEPWPPPEPELQVLDPAQQDRALDLIRARAGRRGDPVDQALVARTVAMAARMLTAEPGAAPPELLPGPPPGPPPPGPAGPCEAAAASAKRPGPGTVSWWPQ